MKKLSIFLAMLLLLSLLAGCSNTPASTSAPENTAAKTDAATTAPATEQDSWTEEDVHPMLFHVTGENGQEMYLFGTIHVGDARTDIALQKLAPYLEDCDALAVEFDIVAFEGDTAAQVKAMTQFTLTDGSTVEDHMPAETYEQASALLQKANLYPNLMKYYNLPMWSQLVEQAALMTKSSLDMEAGMDRRLIDFCYDKQIPVRDVESAELQYGLMAGFSDELSLLLIETTLKRLDRYGAEIDELYSAWAGGNYDEIVAVLNREDELTEDLTEAEQALVDDYNDKMLTQRNLGMRDKAVEWLQAGDKVFFAVGAAHLVDEGGLVDLLRAAGYTVEQLQY
ncbi:MAG: TraB/GumN family protein [Oscillospiraceae bacterium]|nr:TraB/GumN family protein [Oscillospiraceae bacterium]